MGLFDLFKRESRELPLKQDDGISSAADTLEALLTSDTMTREIALQIPAISQAVTIISDLIAAMDINLYKETGFKVEKIKDDRVVLLNDETGDMVSSYDLKKNLVIDYLLDGNGYAYINRNRNKVKSLHYVKPLSVSKLSNPHPIFKDGKLSVYGTNYESWEFITLLNNSSDGLSGDSGLLKRNSDVLTLAYNIMKLQNNNMLTGGTKRGVLKSEKRLSEGAITALKSAWQNLYAGSDSSTAIVLNEGISFQELSQSATELQLLDIYKKTSDDLLGLLGVPKSIVDGTASDEEFNNFIKITIMPIIKNFETILNKNLLINAEKEAGYYFAFDTKQLLKGDIEKRFRAYEIGIKNKILDVNEARYEEDREPIEAFNNTVFLGLNDVLYNTKTGNIYTPNTDKTSSMKGGENVGSEIA